MKEKIFYAKESSFPLYKKGDKFIIIKRNNNPNLMSIEAMRLKDRQIYGFEEGDLI